MLLLALLRRLMLLPRRLPIDATPRYGAISRYYARLLPLQLRCCYSLE